MKLDFELIPDGCWGSNLRTVLPPEMWNAIRKDAYARAGGKCAICGDMTRLEAHERWSYDEERGIQKLEDVIAVCPLCHAVIHIGRTQLKGDERAACAHYMKVNGVGYAEYLHALGEANKVHARRNRVPEWTLDLGWLRRFSTKTQ